MPDPPERRFRGTLTDRDVKRHIPHAFDVPSGTTRLTVQLDFEPPVVDGHRNMICLTLLDPAGFRGAGHRHGNRHAVEIGHNAATPGFLPGPLPPGRWVAQLDTHMVMPGAGCRYEVAVTVDRDGAAPAARAALAAATPRFDQVVNDRPGWYRGDLHAHTVHSDGAWQVADLVAAARSRGLDFVTLTDHNTTSGLAEMARHSGDGLLTLGGQELTTFWGHALCLGGHAWRDWRVTRDGPEMAALANRIGAAGALYVIAHPRTEGDPHCTGCRWVYPAMMPGAARLVEVWNGDWFGHGARDRDRNEEALRLWYHWLNRGHRLVATAGTDVHGPGRQYDSASTGFSVVYADQLSEAGILRAVAAGHLYLSRGPRLSLAARRGPRQRGMMGDRLAARGEAGAVSLAASWEGVSETALLHLVADGRRRDTLPLSPVSAAGTHEWAVDPAVPAARWYTLEMRAEDGTMMALTNPIFLAAD